MGVEELVAAPAIKGATEAGAKGVEAGVGSSLLAPELAGAGALDVVGGAGATAAGAEGLAGGAAALAPTAASFLGGADLGTTGVSPAGLSSLDPAAAGGGSALPGGTATPALGATAPGGTAPVGLPGTGITPSALSVDPTAAAAGGAPAGGPLSVAGGASTAAGGAAAPAGGSSGFSLESLLGGAGKSIASNPLGIALAAGGLGYNALQGQKMSDAQKKLSEEAAQLNGQGKELASYLLNGNLPPGLQASVDQATSAAKARVRSNFAAQGLSTDPSKNTALQQELAMIDQQAVITIAQIGQQLLGAGQSASGLSSQLYTTLANLDQTQTQRIGSAVASMAAALSPSKGLTINAGKTA